MKTLKGLKARVWAVVGSMVALHVVLFIVVIVLTTQLSAYVSNVERTGECTRRWLVARPGGCARVRTGRVPAGRALADPLLVVRRLHTLFCTDCTDCLARAAQAVMRTDCMRCAQAGIRCASSNPRLHGHPVCQSKQPGRLR